MSKDIWEDVPEEEIEKEISVTPSSEWEDVPENEIEQEEDVTSSVMDTITSDHSKKIVAPIVGGAGALAAREVGINILEGADDRIGDKTFKLREPSIRKTHAGREFFDEEAAYKIRGKDPYITRRDIGKQMSSLGMDGMKEPTVDDLPEIGKQSQPKIDELNNLLKELDSQVGKIPSTELEERKLAGALKYGKLHPDEDYKAIAALKNQGAEAVARQEAFSVKPTATGLVQPRMEGLKEIEERKRAIIAADEFEKAKQVDIGKRAAMQEASEELVEKAGKTDVFKAAKKGAGTVAETNRMLKEIASKEGPGFLDDLGNRPNQSGLLSTIWDASKKGYRVGSIGIDKKLRDLNELIDEFGKRAPKLTKAAGASIPIAGTLAGMAYSMSDSKASEMPTGEAFKHAAIQEGIDEATMIPAMAALGAAGMGGLPAVVGGIALKEAVTPGVPGATEYRAGEEGFEDSVFKDEAISPEYKLEHGQELTEEERMQLESPVREPAITPEPAVREPSVVKPKTLDLAKATEMSPDEITNRTQQMVAKYGDKASPFANVLNKAATSTDRTRTALMFSLYQQPAFRKMFLEDDA